ncbi:hypothetical protein CFP56_030652 [Quercus suber]|uniref:Uncharacterized protein n=1 Tax=Quercus suber TaxID=58331 RepID=A0AAW0LTN6_QUESU
MDGHFYTFLQLVDSYDGRIAWNATWVDHFFAATTASQLGLSCINSCGSLSIPYPFGTSERGLRAATSWVFLTTLYNSFVRVGTFDEEGVIKVASLPSLFQKAKVSHLLLHYSRPYYAFLPQPSLSSATEGGRITDFIKASCSATSYPALCASPIFPHQLAQIALSVRA